MEPSSRDEFEIAIICALTREADAVEALFDDIYDKFSRRYSKQTGDVNTYINGRLGPHDVVLCYLPEMGKRSAAAAAANLRVSYPNIKLALVVGICGGIPFVPPNKTEVIMGDVILSNSVVEYDFGKQYPDGFRRRSDPREILGRASAEIRGFFAGIGSRSSRRLLKERMRQNLDILQAQDDTVWKYPGNNNDVLFPASLRHQHSSSDSKGSCVCFECNSKDDRVCDEAIEGDCESVGCSGSKIQRARLAAKDPDPSIHIGSIACADTVMKSGEHRDRLAKQEKIIGLEMESAGVWDNLPCIIIKGVCDYADSHKNKYWQDYAAGTAACCTKAFLEDWWSSSQRPREPSQGGWPPYLEQPAIVHKSSTLGTIAGQLREYYAVPQRLRVTRISGESLPMSQCYINLRLVEKPQFSHRCTIDYKADPFLSMSHKDLNAAKPQEKVVLNDIFNPRPGADGKETTPRRILVEGRAGVGKTTLCKKIVHDYIHQGMWNRNFNLLLWIPLRCLKGTRADNPTLCTVFYDLYFHDLPEGRMLADALQRMLFECSSIYKILLLLDGLDEVSQDWNVDSPMYNLLLRLFNQPHVIVTSRPYGMNLGKELFDLETEVIGFNHKQVETYIRKVGSRDPHTADRIISFADKDPHINGFLRIPVQLDAFCYSWSQGFMTDSEPTTKTLLYEALVLKLWQKDLLRLVQDTGRGLNEHLIRGLAASQIQELIPSEIDLVERIAFIGIYNGVIEFNASHRHRIYAGLKAKEVSMPPIPEMVLQNISFLSSSGRIDTDPNCIYHFIHLTFQEYFAARYFVTCWELRQPLTFVNLNRQAGFTTPITPQAFFLANKYNSRYAVMWQFVTGLLDVHSTAQHDSTALREFFDLLEAEPRDLLGFAHLRLLMNCIVEVAVASYGILDQGRINRQILSWIDSGYGPLVTGIVLTSEREYPQHILQKLVSRGPGNTQRLLMRETYSPAFVCALYTLTSSSQPLEISHYSDLSQELLVLAAFEALLQLLDNGKLRGLDIRGLWTRLDRFPLISKHLVKHLNGGSVTVRRELVSSLHTREVPAKALTAEVLTALVPLVEDPGERTQYEIVEIFKAQHPLPSNVIQHLVDILTRGERQAKRYASQILGLHGALPADILSHLLKDELPSGLHFLPHEDPSGHYALVTAIAKCEYLTPEMVLPCLRSGDRLAGRVLKAICGRSQQPLSSAILEEVCLFTRSASEEIRVLVAIILVTQTELSAKMVEAIIPLLQDDNITTRFIAVLILHQQPTLPAACAKALYESEPATTYYRAVSVDLHKPFSEEHCHVILPFLRRTEVQYISRVVVEILSAQPSFSPGAQDAIIAFLGESPLHMEFFPLLHRELHPKALDDLLGLFRLWLYWGNDGILEILRIQKHVPLQTFKPIVSQLLNDPAADKIILFEALDLLPDLPTLMVKSLFRMLDEYNPDWHAEVDKLLRKHGKLHQDLPGKYWGCLSHSWFTNTRITCCLDGHCLVITAPEGVTKVHFGTKQLRVFRHEFRKTQLRVGIPLDTLVTEEWGDWARVRLTGGLL